MKVELSMYELMVCACSPDILRMLAQRHLDHGECNKERGTLSLAELHCDRAGQLLEAADALEAPAKVVH